MIPSSILICIGFPLQCTDTLTNKQTNISIEGKKNEVSLIDSNCSGTLLIKKAQILKQPIKLINYFLFICCMSQDWTVQPSPESRRPAQHRLSHPFFRAASVTSSKETALAMYPAAAAGGPSQGWHLLPRSHFVALAVPSDFVCPRLQSRPRLAVREIWGEEVHVLDRGRFGRSAKAAATTAGSPPSGSRWRPGEPFPSIRLF
jgi:hypothetical protein